MKKNSTVHISVGIGIVCASTLTATNARAQNTPPATTVTDGTNTKLAQQWRDDDRLNAKITLQAKRMPLGEVLKSLSEQSGVTLNGSDLATTKRVTLSVQDMELRAAMEGLEDLYQGDWQTQDGKNYVLRQREMLPWRSSLARLGNINNWGFYRTNWSRPFAPPYLTTPYAYEWEELLDTMDRKALESPQGVPFSSLPPELQQEVRRVTSWEIKKQAVEGIALRDRAEGDWTLRIMPENYPDSDMIEFFNAPIPDKPGPPMVQIISGSTVLAMFPFGQDIPEFRPGNNVIRGR